MRNDLTRAGEQTGECGMRNDLTRASGQRANRWMRNAEWPDARQHALRFWIAGSELCVLVILFGW